MVALLFSLSLCASSGHGEILAYRWLAESQRENGLIASNDYSDRCYVYDQALAAIAFVSERENDRAEQIFDFFDAYRLRMEKSGGFWGFPDFFLADGAPGAGANRSTGNQAWLLIALNRYHNAAGTRRYEELSRAITDHLLILQAREGGFAGGMDHLRRPLLWFSLEHAFDAVAALRNLQPEAALKARSWIFSHRQENGCFPSGPNNSNFVLDVVPLSILVFGDECREGLAEAEKWALTTHEYRKVRVEGFDGGGITAPDKDAVWFEGTAQMVAAYRAIDLDDSADYFLRQLASCLTPSPKIAGTSGLPVASNPGTPAFGGWTMTDSPIAVAPTAWFYFAARGINPMTMDHEARMQSFSFFPVLLPIIEDAEASPIAFGLSWFATRTMRGALEIDNPMTIMRLRLFPTGRNAWGIAERIFTPALNWNPYRALRFRTRGDAVRGIVRIEDSDGELWETPVLDPGDEWRTVEISLRDFTRNIEDGPDGDGIFGAEKITSMRFILHAEGSGPAEWLIDDVSLR